MRGANVGAAHSVEPSSGWVDLQRTVFDDLRPSTRLPGCSSWSRLSVRPAKPLQTGVLDEVCPPDEMGVEVVDGEPEGESGLRPFCPPGMLPTGVGKGRVPGTPRGALPKPISIDMCDCSSDWSMR